MESPNGAISRMSNKSGKAYASTLVDIFNVPVKYHNENGNEVILLSNKLQHLYEKYAELKEIVIDAVVTQYNEAEKEATLERGIPKKMKISKFNQDKGFGFVELQHNKNIFFHLSDDKEFKPTKRRGFNPIELKEGDEIFVYGTIEESRGLRVTKRSKNNLMDKKISEFKDGFKIDTKSLENIASQYFFDHLTDEEILALGPVYIGIGIPIKVRDLELEAKCPVLNIKLGYNDDIGVNLCLKQNNKERIIPINIKQNIVNSDYNGIIFSIDSLLDFKKLKQSIPESLIGYIVGDSTKEYPQGSNKIGEYMNVRKSSRHWEVQADDRNLAVLDDKNTEIVGVDGDTGSILIKNDLLDELGLCSKTHIYKLNACTLINNKDQMGYKGMPYLSYRNGTQKDLQVINRTLPYYKKYFEEKYTNNLIGDLEEHPEKYLIIPQPHMFADASSGEYFSVTGHLDPDVFFKLKKEKYYKSHYIQYSLIDHDKVKKTIENILKKTDNLKEIIIDKNYSFVIKVLDAYDNINTTKKHLESGGGRVKRYEYKEHRPTYSDDLISGLYDQQEDRILIQRHTYSTIEQTGGGRITLGGDGWRRGMDISVPVKRENTRKTVYSSCLGNINSIETLAQEIEKDNSHPIFDKLLQDKQLENNVLEEAGQSDRVLQYKLKKTLSILCDRSNLSIPYEIRDKVYDELKKIQDAQYVINASSYIATLNEIKSKVNYLINIVPEKYNALVKTIMEIKKYLHEETVGYDTNLVINELDAIHQKIAETLRLANELIFNEAENTLNKNEIMDKIKELKHTLNSKIELQQISSSHYDYNYNKEKGNNVGNHYKNHNLDSGKPSLTSSNDAMEEALRQAGLI